MSDRKQVRKYMFLELQDRSNKDIWPATYEVNCTRLAENAAHFFEHDEWLDDETHWVWELAVDLGSDAECRRQHQEEDDEAKRRSGGGHW